MSFDVFLSYHSPDGLSVEKIARRLRERNIVVWFDRWHMKAGVDFRVEMKRALEKSASCAVFLSSAELGPWHATEVADAVRLRFKDPVFKLIPVLLPPAKGQFSDTLKDTAFRWQSAINFEDEEDESALDRLVSAIECDRPAAAPLEPIERILDRSSKIKRQAEELQLNFQVPAKLLSDLEFHDTDLRTLQGNVEKQRQRLDTAKAHLAAVQLEVHRVGETLVSVEEERTKKAVQTELLIRKIQGCVEDAQDRIRKSIFGESLSTAPASQVPPPEVAPRPQISPPCNLRVTQESRANALTWDPAPEPECEYVLRIVKATKDRLAWGPPSSAPIELVVSVPKYRHEVAPGEPAKYAVAVKRGSLRSEFSDWLLVER